MCWHIWIVFFLIVHPCISYEFNTVLLYDARDSEGVEGDKMDTIDTYKARVVKVLYQDGAYPPQIMKVADAADAIAPPSNKPKALQAINKTVLDSFSPAVYVQNTGRSAISFGRGSVSEINKHAREWIKMHDENEMPDGLK